MKYLGAILVHLVRILLAKCNLDSTTSETVSYWQLLTSLMLNQHCWYHGYSTSDWQHFFHVSDIHFHTESFVSNPNMCLIVLFIMWVWQRWTVNTLFVITSNICYIMCFQHVHFHLWLHISVWCTTKYILISYNAWFRH